MAVNDPKGNLVTPVGMDPDGNPKALMVNAAGELIVTGGGDMTTDYKARAYLGTDQPVATATPTTVELDTETYDPNGDFNLVTSEYIAPVGGYYLIVGSAFFGAAEVVADKWVNLRIVVNDNRKAESILHSSHESYVGGPVTDVLHLDEGDSVTLAVQHTFGVEKDLFAGPTYTWLSIHVLSLD